MIILGLDPGTTTIGYGIIKSEKKRIQCLGFGCIATKPKLNKADKLIEIGKQYNSMLKNIKPDAVVIEDIYFYKNLKTAIRVSEARGVLLYLSKLKKYKIIEPTPLQIKQVVTGYGQADKTQVQKMVKILLNLKELPEPDDAADALAAAIYGFNIYKSLIQKPKFKALSH